MTVIYPIEWEIPAGTLASWIGWARSRPSVIALLVAVVFFALIIFLPDTWGFGTILIVFIFLLLGRMWRHPTWLPMRRYRIDEKGIMVREGAREKIFAWQDCKDYHLRDAPEDNELLMIGVVDKSEKLGKLIVVRSEKSLDVIGTSHAFVLQTNTTIESDVIETIASRLPKSPLEAAEG
ncbi:MAG: hypothetical protein HZC01_03085 [Candidatus Kerfeldbacteria bacterium]|nr:hypothetical protein [Candidatus Kerfeldbacteria bacterium]